MAPCADVANHGAGMNSLRANANRSAGWHGLRVRCALHCASACLVTAALPAVAAGSLAPQDPADRSAAAHDRASTTAAPVDWIVVDDVRLDTMRGGFDVGGGLTVSFGISRAISINGDLVATTSFTIPDASRLSQGQATALAAGLGDVKLVQNGPGNTAPALAGALTSGGTIIQNTLNDQAIKNVTTINASVNSLGLLRGLNAQSSLNDALRSAATSR